MQDSDSTTPPPGRLAPLSTSIKAGWGSGVLGSGTMLVLSNVLLLYFLVSHVGLSPALAGVILFVTRLYDMGSDIFLGVLIDRIATRWGRRHPWMILGALFSTGATFALFNVPLFSSQTLSAVYVTVALIFFYTGYTLFTIPHTALSAEMTEDYAERTSLMAFRTLFSTCSGVATYVGAPWLIAYLGSDRGAYGTTAAAYSVVVLLAFLSAVFFTRGVRQAPAPREPVAIRKALSVVLENRPYALLLGAKLCMYTALSIVGATQLFAVKYLLGRAEGFFGTLSLVAYIVMLLAIPLWTRITHRFGKSNTLIWTLATAYVISHLSWLLATPAEPPALSMLRMALGGLGLCALTLCGYAMLPDTIDYDFRRSGLQRGAVMAGMYAFVEKTGFALGPMLCGFVLQASGFSSGADAQQSTEAVNAVRWCVAIGPSAMALLALPLLRAYGRHEPSMRALAPVAAVGS